MLQVSTSPKCRVGHFRYFLIFSIIKNIFFCIFYQVKKPISAPVLLKKSTLSQINLIKNEKIIFIIEKIQKYQSFKARNQSHVYPMWALYKAPDTLMDIGLEGEHGAERLHPQPQGCPLVLEGKVARK